MSSTGNPRRVRIENLPFGSLKIDEATQRKEIPARVKYLIKNWDLAMVGTLTVSQRGDGFYIANGQHRWRAAFELGLASTKVRCEVIQNASVEEEAALFLALNDTRAVNALDKFRVGLTANDPTIVGVQEILDEFGLKASSQYSDGHIACVDRLLKLYRQDPELLRSVLQTTTDAWGTTYAAVDNLLLGGLAKVLATYNGELERDVLVKKLAKATTPSALIGKGRELSKIRPISAQRAVAEIVRDTYNKGRRNELGAL